MNTPDNKSDDILVIDEVDKKITGQNADEIIIDDSAASERRVTLPDGKVKLTLKYPVTYKIKPASGMGSEREETITELIFRRPTGGDMTAQQKFRDSWEQAKVLISRCANVNILLLEKFDLDDLLQCGEVMDDFLPSVPKTGKPASPTSH